MMVKLGAREAEIYEAMKIGIASSVIAKRMGITTSAVLNARRNLVGKGVIIATEKPRKILQATNRYTYEVLDVPYKLYPREMLSRTPTFDGNDLLLKALGGYKISDELLQVLKSRKREKRSILARELGVPRLCICMLLDDGVN